MNARWLPAWVTAAIGVLLVVLGADLVGFALVSAVVIASLVHRAAQPAAAAVSRPGGTSRTRPPVRIGAALVSVGLGVLLLVVTWPLVDGASRGASRPGADQVGATLFGTWFAPVVLVVLVAAVAGIGAAALNRSVTEPVPATDGDRPDPVPSDGADDEVAP